MVGLPTNLEYLQLRVGTNGSPTPFFHPTLAFSRCSNLRSLNIVEITDLESLISIGKAIFSTERLIELTLSANKDSRLPVAGIFASWTAAKSLDLRILDLRGFSNLGCPAESLWESVNASRVRELTIDIGESEQPLEDFAGFWEAATAAGVQLIRLETNLITGGLSSFLRSFNGLEILILLPCLLESYSFQPLSPFLLMLAAEQSSSLRVLSVRPQGLNETEYLLDQYMLASLTTSCTQLQEVAFGINGHDVVGEMAHLEIPITPGFPFPQR
jgi:hypothetical protein